MNLENLRRDIINEKLTLYQIKDGLLFGTDALLLADFICAESSGAYNTGAELGAGSGVISLLLAVRGKIKLVHALEVQQIYAELAAYNARVNGLEQCVRAVCADLKDYAGMPAHSADIIFTNPPYLKAGEAGMLSPLDHKNIARREICCDISDVMRASARLLKNGGDFYAVYRPDRLAGLFAAMAAHSIAPKKLGLVYAGGHKPASLVLVKGKQGAGEGLIVKNIFL